MRNGRQLLTSTMTLMFVFTSLMVCTPAPATAETQPWDPFFAAPTTVASFTEIGANPRTYGIAAGDFTGEGHADVVIGRALGQVHFAKGNGDGTFQAKTQFAWKQAALNVWAMAAGDVDGDGKLDVIWGATAASPGCTKSVPTGSTCAGVGGTAVTVNDGDVRVFYGNGDGTFAETPYYVTTALHNAGTLLANVGLDAASLSVGDVDGDGDPDIVVGAVDGSNATVKLLRNNGGSFTAEIILSVPAGSSAAAGVPIYYPPAASASNVSPWGLALGDVDADGDLDLWVGDRALYLYLYRNNGSGTFTLLPPATPPLETRPNAMLVHDSFRASVGYTPSLACADLNGDGKADLVIGLQSGGQSAAASHDGEILLRTSTATDYAFKGATILADLGMIARGATVLDMNSDGYRDIVAGEYAGMVALLRQLAPLDTDIDGISDYLDNAPGVANAPRIDMNADGALTARDQLDNDFDTVLGNPEFPTTWLRLGDGVDDDDDNDGVLNSSDNCRYVANAGQGDVDDDGQGDACDPLDNRDQDQDGVLGALKPGDPLYDAARAAAIKWGMGSTRFVIRIDALGRFFQNEFTQIMTDAAVLSPADWAQKCWENYETDDFTPPYQPCGSGGILSLDGGRQVPVSLAVIPKQLWTDPPVLTWINDRNNYVELEIVQHGAYHVDNTPNGDWKTDTTRNFYSCETCGLTEAENFELLKVGHDTLLGNYSNKWLSESGATDASKKIDWSTSAHPLISYAPPYNASDTMSRKATAQLGYRGFSASKFEEEAGFLGNIFSPEGSHMERFDQFGMFHASADLQLNPPNTANGAYNRDAYQNYLADNTLVGRLNTWLIEEVDWSGRPCPDDDRLGTCKGLSNREDNTVYQPRWEAWLQLLDYVKNYQDGVALTIGEVALAHAYDNAPTVPNQDQKDSNHNGIGDVIDGANFTNTAAALSRNVAGTLSVKLVNGAALPIVKQAVTFAFDADGDGTSEIYSAITDEEGVAASAVTSSRPVGQYSYTAAWDGVVTSASANGAVTVGDATHLVLDASNPGGWQTTDDGTVGATLTDNSGTPLPDQPVVFLIDDAVVATATTDTNGHAAANLTLTGNARTASLQANFAGTGLYGPSSASAMLVVAKEDTLLKLNDAVAVKNKLAQAVASLTETDGGPVAGASITFYIQQKTKAGLTWLNLGAVVSDARGFATLSIPSRYNSTQKSLIKAVFTGNSSFLQSEGSATTYRQ